MHSSPACPGIPRTAGRIAPLLAATATALFSAGSAGADQNPAPAAPQAPPPVVRLNVADVRQPIFGFGGSQTYSGELLADFGEREAVYKALFGDLKLDFYRLRNYYGYPGQEKRFDTITRDFGRAARRWSDPKLRGGKGPVRLMFTAWSPPPALKSNGLVSGRSDGKETGLQNATLKRGADGKFAYGEYADWWLASVRHFHELVGAYPDYISLQNELDLSVPYEGCRFLPTEGTTKEGYALAGYDSALAAVSERLTGALGTEAPRILGPEPFTIQINEGKNRVQSYLDPTTASGKASLSRLFGVSFHIYGNGAGQNTPQFATALASLRDTYRVGEAVKPLFQTEFLEGDTFLSLANLIHESMTEGDVSAYFVWIVSRSTKTPGLAMVYFNPDDGTVEKRERYYAVKHYSAFVGEGWHRVTTDGGDPDVKVSAYIGPGEKELVAVLINPTGGDKKVTLQPSDSRFANAPNVTFRSSQGEDGERWHDLGPLPTGNMVTLTRRSMVTVKFTRP